MSKRDLPPRPAWADDYLSEKPHSLMPVALTGNDDEDGAEPESAWDKVWRRRWFVAGAGLVAFASAFAFGRLHAERWTSMERPTLSRAAQPSTPNAMLNGVDVGTSMPTLPNPPVAPMTTSEPLPSRATVAPTPPATGEFLEIPPMEVPPVNGDTKFSAKRAVVAGGAAPKKRFTPDEI